MPLRRWIGIATLCLAAFAQEAGPPIAPKRPVTDEYHGVRVTDDYRWLEDWSNPETQAWSNAENKYARQYLDGIKGREQLREQLKAIESKPSARFFNLQYGGKQLFAMRQIPPKEQPFLVTLGSVDDLNSSRVVVDPAQIDASGHTAIDFFVPSHDGKYVAVSMSHGGSESGDVRIYETATGKALGETIPRVNGGTAGGSVAWNADDSGFYYTRYPHAGERPDADLNFYQQVWFHKLGSDAASDQYSIGKEFPRIAEIVLKASDNGDWLLATVANGDGGEFLHYLKHGGADWQQFAGYADQVTEAEFGANGFLYLLSTQGAPKSKVMRVALSDPRMAKAETIVPESGMALERVVPAGEKLYVAAIDGGPSVVRVFDKDGKHGSTLPLEENSSVGDMLPDGKKLLFQGTSYVKPAAWYRFDAGSGKITPTSLHSTAAVDFSDIEVTRHFATSKDGTQIPLTILMKKGTPLNGANPVLLTGYGGYRISIRPHLNESARPLLDRGVVYAIANLRGGGEYGEAWHAAGNLTHKQNVFDDFEACARYLIGRHYTKPQKLAIMGGSNGGLLMGAAFTQHPELYGAVVSMVGIYDMLRSELSPNGAFNVTEFGTVKETDQFKALYAYSPYHHVNDNTQYPAILFATGANDPRVDPMNSRKMTARLQATGTKKPVLLRTSSTAGHGIGTALSERIELTTDIDSFLLHEWGLE